MNFSAAVTSFYRSRTRASGQRKLVGFASTSKTWTAAEGTTHVVEIVSKRDMGKANPFDWGLLRIRTPSESPETANAWLASYSFNGDECVDQVNGGHQVEQFFFSSEQGNMTLFPCPVPNLPVTLTFKTLAAPGTDRFFSVELVESPAEIAAALATRFLADVKSVFAFAQKAAVQASVARARGSKRSVADRIKNVFRSAWRRFPGVKGIGAMADMVGHDDGPRYLGAVEDELTTEVLDKVRDDVQGYEQSLLGNLQLGLARLAEGRDLPEVMGETEGESLADALSRVWGERGE